MREQEKKIKQGKNNQTCYPRPAGRGASDYLRPLLLFLEEVRKMWTKKQEWKRRLAGGLKCRTKEEEKWREKIDEECRNEVTTLSWQKLSKKEN